MKNIYLSLLVLTSFLIIAEEMEKSKANQKVREIVYTRLEKSRLYSTEKKRKRLNQLEEYSEKR